MIWIIIADVFIFTATIVQSLFSLVFLNNNWNRKQLVHHIFLITLQICTVIFSATISLYQPFFAITEDAIAVIRSCERIVAFDTETIIALWMSFTILRLSSLNFYYSLRKVRQNCTDLTLFVIQLLTAIVPIFLMAISMKNMKFKQVDLSTEVGKDLIEDFIMEELVAPNMTCYIEIRVSKVKDFQNDAFASWYTLLQKASNENPLLFSFVIVIFFTTIDIISFIKKWLQLKEWKQILIKFVMLVIFINFLYIPLIAFTFSPIIGIDLSRFNKLITASITLYPMLFHIPHIVNFFCIPHRSKLYRTSNRKQKWVEPVQHIGRRSSDTQIFYNVQKDKEYQKTLEGDEHDDIETHDYSTLVVCETQPPVLCVFRPNYNQLRSK